jgi:YggT family protein
MITIVLLVIYWIFRVFSLLLVIDIFLNYLLKPYHPVRRFLDGIFNPLLKPFRKLIPLIGGLDLSPIFLIVTFWLLDYIIHLLFNLIG